MKLSRLAVINGDDFGFSSGVNRAIITAYQKGVLTSTSLMVTGEAFEEAVALAKANPNLGVGLHLVLVCGRSALPPEQIPHLVDGEGNFPDDSVWAGLRYQFSTAARNELRQEIRAQLEKFRQTGLNLTHVDGHLHLHMHPVVLKILVELSEEFQIPTMRLPLEELSLTLAIDRRDWLTKLVWSIVFGQLRHHGEKLLQARGITYPERVYGLLQTSCMTEDYLLALIPHIPCDRIEIYSHPAFSTPDEPLNGPSGAGEQELAALVSARVRECLSQNGFQLTNYQQIRQRG